VKALEATEVIRLFDEGVDALVDAADERHGREWHKTVVGEWSGHELARHLLAVCEWYHAWLDRSEGGDGSPPFPSKQLAGRNELAILDLGDLDGPAAIDRFAERAADYRVRLLGVAETNRWDLPYGFANGTTTIGGHAGIAAGEWHLHAWDLRQGDHVPANPDRLYLAVGHGMTLTQPAWKRAITRRVVARIAKRDPWTDLVRRSGRRT
jgi:hypothetical protein